MGLYQKVVEFESIITNDKFQLYCYFLFLNKGNYTFFNFTEKCCHLSISKKYIK